MIWTNRKVKRRVENDFDCGRPITRTVLFEGKLNDEHIARVSVVGFVRQNHKSYRRTSRFPQHWVESCIGYDNRLSLPLCTGRYSSRRKAREWAWKYIRNLIERHRIPYPPETAQQPIVKEPEQMELVHD